MWRTGLIHLRMNGIGPTVGFIRATQGGFKRWKINYSMGKTTTKRGPYASVACRGCSESHQRCELRVGTAPWSESNPCVRCHSRGLKCKEQLPKGAASAPVTSSRSRASPVAKYPAFESLPLPPRTLTEYQYEQCIRDGTLEANRLLPAPAWGTFKDTLLSDTAASSEGLNPFLHCTVILPQLRPFVSPEVLQKLEDDTMSYLGREFLHPTLETIWGAILLSCYMRSHNPTCSKGLLVISHWWLNGLNEHDGPGNVPVVMLRHRLAALVKSDSSNTQNQCPGAPYPVAQQIVTAELPASFHTAEPIGSMPTEQVSPRQSHEFGGTAEMDEPSASAPSGMHGIENLVIPRSSSPPAFVHGGVLTPSSVDAPLPCAIGLSTLAHALAAASAGPFHLTQPNNSMTTPNTVVPGQVFPLQHCNAVHSNVVNASTVYGPPATEYGTTAQPPRRYSYAEIARRGLNLA